ncbi:transcriptional regulator [Kitasatospora sp. MBT66]|uniref:transcriptional regulator n=1 Tax=Kitasatospora sp. MBT66 TaxID=1444769 RepID=UPI0005B8DED5|nr:transcriptional regulator [Kitasatospora sp. MBT66]
MTEPEYRGEQPAKDQRKKFGLGEAFYRAVTKRSPKSEPKTAEAQVGWLAKRFKGDHKKAAEKAGVSPTTFKRWMTGKQKPGGKSAEKLTKAVRAELVPEGRRSRIAGSTDKPTSRTARATGGFSIEATIRISNDTREREIMPGRHLSPGALNKVMSAFMEGNDEQAMAELNEVLKGYFGTSAFEVLDVTGLDLSPIEWHEPSAEPEEQAETDGWD